MSFTINEVGAGTTAASLGFFGPAELYGPYSLFGCLENLQTALLDNDGAALDTIIGEIESVIENLLEIEAEVGARGEQVEIVTNQLIDEKSHLEESLSLVEEVDMAEVLTKLAEAQTTYKAALQTAAGIFELSLLNFMK